MMDEYIAETFAGSEDPVPPPAAPDDNDGGQANSEKKRDKLKHAGSKLKGKLHDAVTGKALGGHSLQDRLFSKILEQIVPEDELDDVLEEADERSSKYTHRPSFSLPLMTNNFRRFNARIGTVFVFENRLIRLLSWKTPSQTLSLLAVSTFICLDPYLLAVLPLASAVFFIMVPAFLHRHPPPPPDITHAASYSMNGPPLAPPRTLKPATEMSKDFFRNMRDLQNSMDDFSVIHDAVIDTVTPRTNFSNEPLSSTIYLVLFISSCLLFISSHLLPWRYLSLAICWTAIPFGHPGVQKLFWANREEHIKPHERTVQSWFEKWILQDTIIDTAPETRETEIFELHRRKGGPQGEWEAWMFSPSPYDPLSPQRISGDRPKGAQFFEDVAAPPGWEWGDKKWVLDISSKVWVEERMMQGVEVEIEGERWVYDLVMEGGGGNGGEKPNDAKVSATSEVRRRDGEQGQGSPTRGEWRRRRWIRTVRREVFDPIAAKGD